ncbi:MAG: helix-turn-helix domain-containing protein [Coriobacteriales bacterium]|jgi:transcriptional regulator with XRE-family HTH domain|nr:helix-turn-helix domain-containing protein [Coriobacteriales bacterium]
MEEAYLLEFGRNVQLWRRLQGISASSLASRAGISRNTLASIEKGTGASSLANVFAVLNALGICSQIVQAAQPGNTELGRELIYRMTRNG